MSLAALELVDAWPVDHVAAAVVTPSGIVARRGDGDHGFRLASITKVIVGWAALVAVEEGTIDLDAPPRSVAVQPGCTVRHLLAHAGGYPFEGDEPVSAPERRRIYSNTGIELVAADIASSSGMDFATYLREAVLAPLGMTSSELQGSPAHGVWSTADDLARFAHELLRPQLLAPETVGDAVRPQYPSLAGIVPGVGRFDPCPWGLGMEIRGDKSPHWTGTRNARSTFGHFGGAGTMLWVDPAADVSLLALTDRPFDEWSDQALASWRELSDAVLDEVSAS